MTSLEQRVELSELFDFYGELLKENQKEIFEAYVMNDYSISEIADEHNMSRQAVFDMIKRCTKQLEDYEKKLELIGKFEKARDIVSKIRELSVKGDGASSLAEIRELSEHILDIL